MEFIGLANYARLAQDPAFWKVIGNTFAYLGLGVPISMLLSFVIAYYLDRVRFGHGLLRALYFIPHLTTAVAMAWVWRWFYQPPPVGAFNVWLTGLGFAPDAVPALHDAGAARGAGAGDLGRHRIPDRDLSRRPEGDSAHLLRSRGDRRRRRVARAVRGHAAAAAPDHRVPGGHELDRLPAHLRLRLCDDQRPGRPARRDEAAGAEDLRDRVHALRDGLRRDADGDPVRDPARDLARPVEAACAADDRSRADSRRARSSPGRSCSWAESSW